MNNNKYLISLDDVDKRYLNIEFSLDMNMCCKYICYNILKELEKYKNMIVISNDWDKNKKLTNDYELIYVSTKNINNSIAFYKPLSRAYFKMIEILNTFDLINYNNNNFLSAHLAEGPGGFLEAVYNKTIQKNFKSKKYFAITLINTNHDVPGWDKAYDFVRNKHDIKICYGKDNTGDLYKKDNILFFRDKIGGNKCDLVTADGGFDFSVNFNKQEQLSYRLILCELITTLSIQKIGGNYVCKVFDLFTIASIKLIYLICCFYENVYIYKPLTSRPANSEKYIIAKGFMGIDKNYLEMLFQVIGKWDEICYNGYYINDIFGDTIPTSFLKVIKKYNKINSEIQIDNIKKTLTLINKSKSLSFLNDIIQKQIVLAKNWCNVNKIEINNRSVFILN